MRLKYQLRGLGIGMVLTALLMGISSDAAAKQLSDEDIKVRAKELGMVENIVLSELESKTPTEKVEKTQELEPIEIEPASELESEPESELKLETELESTKMPESEILQVEEVVVIISPGDGSGTVSQKLEQLGLVKNATEYDNYLCKNGYDKKLRTGTYEIQVGATDEEIANKISQK